MVLQYCSDLHLEFEENSKYLRVNPLQPKGNVLVLAGDITLLGLIDKHAWFFDQVSDQFEAVYWTPGNHEFYQFDASTKTGLVNEKIRSNVFLVNNCVVNHGDVQLIFSTLWSKISPINELAIRQGMSDFHLIKFRGGRFTTDHFNQLHEEAMVFLNGVLKERAPGKTVVATHHVPTLMNYPAKYRGTSLNEAFAVELFDFIKNSGADYWIYGHHHQSIPEFRIGDTRLVTNQLGYVMRGEHYQFKPNQTLVV